MFIQHLHSTGRWELAVFVHKIMECRGRCIFFAVKIWTATAGYGDECTEPLPCATEPEPRGTEIGNTTKNILKTNS